MNDAIKRCVLYVALFAAACGAEPLRFGIVADIQYADAEPNGSRFYRNSLEKLEACVDDLNREGVQFTVNLGDLVDRDTLKNLDPVLTRLRRLNAPVFNVTGNHDYQGVTDSAALYAALGMPAPYYSFTRAGWRFIFLNTNELSAYAAPPGSPEAAEFAALRARVAAEKRSNNRTYNGGISQKQLDWLRLELEKAGQGGESVIVFSHHPLVAAEGLTALNDREILALLAASPCVRAVFSGHHHAGAFGTFGGIPCVTFEGMIESRGESAYGVVTLSPDAIEVAGKGRARSRTLVKKAARAGKENEQNKKPI